MSVEQVGGCNRSLQLFEASLETRPESDAGTAGSRSNASSLDQLRLRKVVRKSVLRALSPEDDLRRAYLRRLWRGTKD
jgi:hypothetical protein